MLFHKGKDLHWCQSELNNQGPSCCCQISFSESQLPVVWEIDK